MHAKRMAFEWTHHKKNTEKKWELRSNNLANFVHCVLINEVLEFKRKKIAEEKAKDESSKY